MSDDKIYSALNQLMRACGLSGESGTEELFAVLLDSLEAVEDKWDSVVGQSHRDGLNYNVNAWLAREINSRLSKQVKKDDLLSRDQLERLANDLHMSGRGPRN